MRQNGSAPLLIIALIAVSIISGYLVYSNYLKAPTPSVQQYSDFASLPSPSPVDETKNWKTYTNFAYNFSFKYPPNLAVKEENWGVFLWQPSDTNQFVNIRIKSRPFPEPIAKGQMNISWIQSDGSMVTNDVMPDVVEKVETSKDKISSLGSQTKQYWLGCGNDCGYLVVLLQYNNTYYEFILSTSGGGIYPFTYPVLNQIFSTFKFTDQNQTESTSNWKTYTNTKYQYSFQHPVDFFISEDTDRKVTIRNKESSDYLQNSDENNPQPFPDDKDFFGIFIEVEDNPKNLNADEYFETTIIVPTRAKAQKGDPYSESFLKKYQNSLKPYKNGELSGVSFIGGGENDYSTVIVSSNNKIYKIWFQSGLDTGPGVDPDVQKIFDQILSTFKLINN